MPTTVPNRPSKGLMVAIVPSIDSLLSNTYLTSIAFSSIFDSKFSLGRSLYLIQLINKKPKDDKFDISEACLLFIKSFSNKLTIWLDRPLGEINLF
jgi:hypothetical protein